MDHELRSDTEPIRLDESTHNMEPEVHRAVKTHYMEKEILSVLRRQGYDFGATLPCSHLKELFKLLEKEQDITVVPVTREEEGVGVCAGAHLAGKKTFMLIQSSGLGNSFNAIASLLKTYQIPLLILASYRGQYEEKITAQIPLGIALPGMLEAMEVPFMILRKGTEGLGEFLSKKFSENTPHVVLISPELFLNA